MVFWGMVVIVRNYISVVSILEPMFSQICLVRVCGCNKDLHIFEGSIIKNE